MNGGNFVREEVIKPFAKFVFNVAKWHSLVESPITSRVNLKSLSTI